MTRTSNAPVARRRHRKILKQARGYYGARRRSFRVAKQAVTRAGQYSYRDRRARKRDFRRLWVVRINAQARACGINYSRLIAGLNAAGIELDRKILAHLAVADKPAFQALAEQARVALEH